MQITPSCQSTLILDFRRNTATKKQGGGISKLHLAGQRPATSIARGKGNATPGYVTGIKSVQIHNLIPMQ